MIHYYNEWDAYCAQWLRNLIDAKLIPAGDVDERSIKDAQPDDLKGYVQCHFFAGIAGWPLALRMARWPDDREVWTGSCPCQPFSIAGARKGTADDRHLWPDFYRLITARKPAIVFGEQVASADGRQWLAGVRADLETLAYDVGSADLCAAGEGAPHPRQRLWWVAHPERNSRDPRRLTDECRESLGAPSTRPSFELGRRSRSGRLPNPPRPLLRPISPAWNERGDAPNRFVLCADGKTRRLESELEPLANGVPARVGKLRAYGNAIVPQVAATFIEAYMSCRP